MLRTQKKGGGQMSGGLLMSWLVQQQILGGALCFLTKELLQIL